MSQADQKNWFTDAQKWDKGSVGYKKVADRVSIPFAKDALLLASPAPASSILDVACGSGAFAIQAHQAGHTVLATDFSQGMLDRVAELDPNLPTKVADGQVLDGIGSDQYDCVASIFGIFLFPDRKAGWSSAYRVLKPGGVFTTAVWDVRQEGNFVSLVNSIVKHFPEEKRPQHPTGPGFLETLSDQSNLAQELEEVGFKKVQVYGIQHSVIFESKETLLSGFLEAQAGVNDIFATLSVEEQERCREGYFRELGVEGHDGPVIKVAYANIAVARK